MTPDRHPALRDAWRSVALAGDAADRREAFQAAALTVGGLVDAGEIDRADATDDLIELGVAHPIFQSREDVEHVVSQAMLGVRALAIARQHGNGPDLGAPEPPPRLIQTSAQFVAGFVPPDYVIDGILQRRFCYSFTARTGSGKTAILLLFAAHNALARSIGNREVEPGRVLYFAGENPDDVRARWIAMATEMGFPLDKIKVGFIPGRFKISEMRERIRAEIDEAGGVSLIIVDTSATYYETEDENNNVQMGAHARLLRSLTGMPGGPCVVAACHPIKNASDDNLAPRGGGAFVAEMDGNLTATRNDKVATLHWQIKFRGPDFAPLTFELRTVTNDRIVDSKGRRVPTVVAKYLDEAAQEKIEKTERSREDHLLRILVDHAKASQADLAREAGWFMDNGDPYKSEVARTIKHLKHAKLINQDEREGIKLTPAGRKAIGLKDDAEGKVVDLFPKEPKPK